MKIKDFPQAVINENVDYTVKEITSVIKRYGPRESGNKNCMATQKHIDKEMKPFCDETGFESYKMAPKAFLHFTKTISVAIFLSVSASPMFCILTRKSSNPASADRNKFMCCLICEFGVIQSSNEMLLTWFAQSFGRA